MSTYETAGGGGIGKLFSKKAPNLIPQAVMQASKGRGTIPLNLVALNTKGYNLNAKRYYRYGRDKYKEGLPIGSTNKPSVDNSELLRATTIEARKLAANEAIILDRVANKLLTQLGASHPDYITAKDKATATHNLSRVATVSVATVLSADKTPSTFYRALLQIYYDYGVVFKNDEGKYENEPLFLNTPGYFPIITLINIEVKGIHWQNQEAGLGEPYTIHYTLTDNLGVITAGTIDGFGWISNSIFPSIAEPMVIIEYFIDQIGFAENQSLIWAYDTATNEYPTLFTTSTKNVHHSELMPIACVRRGKEFTNWRLDKDTGEPIDPLGYSAYKMLDTLIIDMIDLQNSIMEAEDYSDIDDAHVGFFPNLTSEDPAIIRYNMKLMEAFREPNGVFPIEEYTDGSLLQQDTYYKDTWPSTYLLAKKNPKYVSLEPNGYVDLKPTVYDITTNYDDKLYRPGETIGKFIVKDAMCTFNAAFIYKEIIHGVIGPKGTTSIYIDAYPSEVYWAADDPKSGNPAGYIEYKDQITNTTYKLIRVHRPQLVYTNWWFGDTWASNGVDVFRHRYSLRGSSSNGITDNAYDMMCIPMLYNVVKTFSGTTETKIYFDSLSILVFTVVVYKIPRWMKIIQIIFILVLAFIAFVVAPAAAGSIIALTVLMVGQVVNIISRLVIEIVTQNIGSKEGAIAGAGIGIAVAIISLGSNISVLLDNVLRLTLSIIGLVIQLIPFTTSIISLQQEKAYNDFEDFSKEEDARLEEAQDNLLTRDTNNLDPLMVGTIWNPSQTANDYYSQWEIDTVAFIFDMTSGYHDLVLELPIEFERVAEDQPFSVAD